MALRDKSTGQILDPKVRRRNQTLVLGIIGVFLLALLYAMMQFLLLRSQGIVASGKMIKRKDALAQQKREEAHRVHREHFDDMKHSALDKEIAEVKQKREDSIYAKKLRSGQDPIEEESLKAQEATTHVVTAPPKEDTTVAAKASSHTDPIDRSKLPPKDTENPCTRYYGDEIGKKEFQETPNYSIQAILDGTGDFADHVDYMVRSQNSKRKKGTWKEYSKADLSSCKKEMPECGMWCHFAGAGHYNLTLEHGNFPFRKCCVEHQKLKDTSIWVMNKLIEAKIPYFLSTGTAIGAYRHSGTIIPWDTDVDIAVYPEAKDDVEKLFKDNGEHYFHNDPNGKPMFWIHHSKTGKPKTGAHVEVFYQKSYSARKDLLEPLQQCDWYGIHSASCPNKKVLDHWFHGSDGWLKPSGCHVHDDGKVTKYHRGKMIPASSC